MSDLWPLFDLRVITPRLELRYIDDEMGHALARLATRGIHDPEFMPFSIPWTDKESPDLERGALQFYWKCRAETSPEQWNILFAVLVEGTVVGTTSLGADNFPSMRQFETGSWLGREFQGRGYGKEMRVATLQFGFCGLDAHWATTGAFEDNAPSLAVTRSLGYSLAGRRRTLSRESVRTLEGYEMPRDHFVNRVQRDDITLVGVDGCRELLGLSG